MMLFVFTIPLSEVLCQGHMQNAINGLLNIECSPLAMKSKAMRGILSLRFAWLFLHGWRAVGMNLLSLLAIQEQAVDSLQT